jgi:hypothetical protein
MNKMARPNKKLQRKEKGKLCFFTSMHSKFHLFLLEPHERFLTDFSSFAAVAVGGSDGKP